jgi:hypothetical protein
MTRDHQRDAFDSLQENPDLGDLVVVLLASSLAGLRDKLAEDGYLPAADLVADLVVIADEYLTHVPELSGCRYYSPTTSSEGGGV